MDDSPRASSTQIYTMQELQRDVRACSRQDRNQPGILANSHLVGFSGSKVKERACLPACWDAKRHTGRLGNLQVLCRPAETHFMWLFLYLPLLENVCNETETTVCLSLHLACAKVWDHRSSVKGLVEADRRKYSVAYEGS